jgi:hypothetical protein
MEELSCRPNTRVRAGGVQGANQCREIDGTVKSPISPEEKIENKNTLR